MKNLSKCLKNEKGALSFEFLGILPFFFLFFLILWQVVASGYALYSVKTAANEGAKSFAATQNINEASSTVKRSIGSSQVTTDVNVRVNTMENGKFELVVSAQHPLVFIPKKWKEGTAISINDSAVGQVLVP